MLNTDRLRDDAPLEELKCILINNKFDLVDKLIEVMQSCHLNTIGAVRKFGSLAELVAELFDTSSRMGQLKAEGYSASLRVSHTFKYIPHHLHVLMHVRLLQCVLCVSPVHRIFLS